MTVDAASLTGMLQATAPFIRTLGLEVVRLDDEQAVLRLPDADPVRNHLGGPHAGAIFSLGESAAAALMVQRFGRWLDRTVPLAVSGDIRWTALARSDVTAHARLLRPAEEVEAELAQGLRPEWATEVVFHRSADGAECARMTVVLTLRFRTD